MIIGDLLWFVAVTGTAAVFLNIIGADLYDIRQVNQRRRRNLHPYTKQYRHRPLVSVLVSVHNDESFIADCLESLIKSSYRKLEIIVADNGSTDATKQVVRRYMAENPKRAIKLYARRKPGNLVECLSYANKKYVSGELVMLLDGHSQPAKAAISRAVMHFNADDSLGGLSVHTQPRKAYKATSLLQSFSLLLKNRVQKANGFFNSAYSGGHEPIIYRRPILAELLRSKRLASPLITLGDKKLRLNYASDVVMYCHALSFGGLVKQYYQEQLWRIRLLIQARGMFLTDNERFSRRFTHLRLPLAAVFSLAAFIAPLLLAYFTYLAVSLHQPEFLVISWAGLVLFLLFAIWEDEQLSLLQKAKYIALMPISYGWFYLMVFLQYLVLLTSWRRVDLESQV